MKQYGPILARTHQVKRGGSRDELLLRLHENENLLIHVHELLVESIKGDRAITPAAEWLLDNFYLVEEQIRTAMRHFPRNYSRELPVLRDGASAGLPRVYDIALELVSHGDGRLDTESLTVFLRSYQTECALTMGELWAVPIMLRLALIENLRRVAARIERYMDYRNRAAEWADQMIQVSAADPKSLILVTADMARSDPPMVNSFVAELARRLQGQGARLALPLTWIEQRLSESGMTVEGLVRAESQQQTADQVTVSNSFASLRLVASMDWQRFVESVGRVDEILRQDPAHVYRRMDFSTRDEYRHVVERLARQSGLEEKDIAAHAITMARAAADLESEEDASSHVGYFLIGAGRSRLQQNLPIRFSPGRLLASLAQKAPFLLYSGITMTIAGSLTAALMHFARGPNWSFWPIACVLFTGATQLSLAIVNWIASLIVVPARLPSMDFSRGIPESLRTIVVVPALLVDEPGIQVLVEALEVRYLGNQDPNIGFALLTDFVDAFEEISSREKSLLEFARSAILELNARRGKSADSPFFLFHRNRKWNAAEKIWMGYERKRGKLSALNRYLRGDKDAFDVVLGATEKLQRTKYVITLDADTILPRDAARKLVGAMAHPLNRPVVDPVRGVVTGGYGILQPRVDPTILMEDDRSRFSTLHSLNVGIDPYTRTVSDSYQDLFGEGSFTGKGIYDVDIVHQLLEHRFPENRILSHDLLEGCYLRSGLLSDVQVYEAYPTLYSTDVKRRHRWIRGDWQIARWILPAVPGFKKKYTDNPLSALSRFKLLDNLRRSLTAPSLFFLLLAGWTLVSHAWFWTLTVTGMILLPSLLSAGLQILRKPPDVAFGQHIRMVLLAAWGQTRLTLLSVVTLPHEAYYSLDAIFRTLWRLGVSHRNLLQWNTRTSKREGPTVGTTAGTSTSGADRGLLTSRVAAVVSIPIAAFLIWFRPEAVAAAAPVLALWLACPVILHWISRPGKARIFKRSVSDELFLRRLARKTYAYFQMLAGAEDHFLPPDNFQEQPPIIAHRTSPTNMGLALLSHLTAWDMGYVSLTELLAKIRSTLDTMDGLERFRGHFFNWYDTQSLQPLAPLYISSVDSGNLAGHLLTLKAGLLDLVESPILPERWLDGLTDTLQILLELLSHAKNRDSTNHTDAAVLSTAGNPLEELFLSFGSTKEHSDAEALAFLSSATAAARIVEEMINDNSRIQDSNLSWWASEFRKQCELFLADGHSYILPEPLASSQTQLHLSPHTILKNADRNQPKAAANNSVIQSGTDHSSDRRARAAQFAAIQIDTIRELAEQCDRLSQMDYRFLYDRASRLLAIGYNVTDARRDSSSYDLLASEARLANFIAIAQGQIPQESWFALGRLVTSTEGEPALLSWSGSMFEYLMPLLVMPDFPGTLLSQTYRSVVSRQIEYGKKRGVPWGVSESGYNGIDAQLNYQYRAFGIPGLGLKRGLADDLVITPYASALALMVDPEAACRNLRRLSEYGMDGRFGLLEALDYTPGRLPAGQSSCAVHSFMAHHQGMTLVALSHTLLDRPMQRRFQSEPMFQSTMLLLQERIPRSAGFFPHTAGRFEYERSVTAPEPQIRVFSDASTHHPEVQLLSNGAYHVMVTHTGSGYSRWRNLAVTRWQEDTTRDIGGTYCYIRDRVSGEYWSTGFQPTGNAGEQFEAIFSEGRAEYRGLNNNLETHIEIVVSPEDDIELRRVRIRNNGNETREIDVTSYAEIVLAPMAADAQHKAFSNLFVQTEILPAQKAILAHRRPRSEEDSVPYLFHQLTVQEELGDGISFETDRSIFLGPRGSAAAPSSMKRSVEDLSGSEGSVLDPIVSIRHRISIAPGESITIRLVTGMGDSRSDAVWLAEKYQDPGMADRVFDLAWTHRQVLLKQLNASESEAQLYGRLASSIIFANESLRAPESTLIRNRRGQSGLWAYAISGDIPVILLQIADMANIHLARQMVQAHAYWRLKGLTVDLVIWNEDHAGYRQALHEQIVDLIAGTSEGNVLDRPGGIFLRPGDQIGDEDRVLVQSVARAIISDAHGSLAEQLMGRVPMERKLTRLSTTSLPAIESVGRAPGKPRNLQYFNGFGGFSHDGSEYIITSDRETSPPTPWVNVIANPNFGTVISDSGTSFTWNENAHAFRLTPWENDPVSDTGGEAMYIRDESTGAYWSPTPLPAPGVNPYVTRHGFGYSIFEHTEQQIESELLCFVAMDAPIKFNVLTLKNRSERPRRLSATFYVEWVLGDLPSRTAMHIVTSLDPLNYALCARNGYNDEFRNSVAFLDVDEDSRTFTGDRTEFLGRNGSMARPEAMQRLQLSGRAGAGFAPCGAIQVPFELQPGEEKEIIFRLGAAANQEDSRRLVKRFRGRAEMRTSLDIVHKHWARTLGAVRVNTPDRAFNLLTNGWLIYQTIVCRMWARTATYQSGGAFGFRDQLQDSMALVHTQPHLFRQHLTLCASRQFLEGDVQHWWHPPSGRGVRTQCSDDYLWLPIAAARYIFSTGDSSVLDETIPYLQGRLPGQDEDSYYDLPGRSEKQGTLFEHCVRAIRYGLKFGSHGLPLIGSGDWNDGMDRVGRRGKGESIWLGFFLYSVLRAFSVVASRRDRDFADACLVEAEKLRRNLNLHGWDGQWWRRAYFDNGDILGASGNLECQIDSIAQSWSVLSCVGSPERAHSAMNALDEYLVSRNKGVIKLLDPPFNGAGTSPGYIQGYAPGVRENGGQYTHAAIWSAMAFAQMGDAQRAFELFAMINPINHSDTTEKAKIYRVEPYVMAADVYSAAPHTGRGGWTWYTGSAAWMYRLAVESILGLCRSASTLYINPCIPDSWEGFDMNYRFEDTNYRIFVLRSEEVQSARLTVDGRVQEGLQLNLNNDHVDHRVELTLSKT